MCFDKVVKKMQHISLYSIYCSWLEKFCKDNNIFLCTLCNVIRKQMPSLQTHRILQGSRMPESQNLFLCFSCLSLSIIPRLFWLSFCNHGKQKLMGNAFVKIATYFKVPHVVTFTNKCHLYKILRGPSMPKSQSCKITEFLRGSRMPKSQTKLSNKHTITFKMLVTSHGQKIDGKCFCKDCNIFLCTPCTVLDGKCFC